MTVLGWVWLIALLVSALPIGAMLLYLSVIVLFHNYEPTRKDYRLLGLLFLIMIVIGGVGAALGLEPPTG